MAEENPKPTAERSTLNAIASIRAGQDQMQKDVDYLKSQNKAILIMALYAAGLSLLVWMLLAGKLKGLGSK